MCKLHVGLCTYVQTFTEADELDPLDLELQKPEPPDMVHERHTVLTDEPLSSLLLHFIKLINFYLVRNICTHLQGMG